MRIVFCLCWAMWCLAVLLAQSWLLAPDRVFDGVAVHTGWVVVVDGGQIVAAGLPVATLASLCYFEPSKPGRR